jgi:CRISPR-associated endoribonuclease Cas6
MIGAVVYRLIAERDGEIPVTQGRLLHAAFFQIIKTFSVKLAESTHNYVRFKPFTVSELFLQDEMEQVENYLIVRKGCIFNWRVTALNKQLLQAILAVPEGYVLQAGPVPMRVDKILTDSDDFGAAAILDENELIAACLSVDKVKHISFSFISPVSFRSFKDDYPFPLPQLIFGSIADKWNLADMPVKLDKDEVREFAAKILPESWRGQTRQVFLKADRGVTGFIGEFTFNVSMCSREMQQLLLLLAQFAQFSGVGRLTTQGLGQTAVKFQ